MCVFGPHVADICGVSAGIPAQHGQVRVGEQRAVVVPVPRAVLRRQADQPGGLGDLTGTYSGGGQQVFGQPGRGFLVGPCLPGVHGVVEPGGERRRPGYPVTGEQVEGLEDLEQVPPVVIAAVRFVPPLQQGRTEVGVLRQQPVPALHQRADQGAGPLPGRDPQSAGDKDADQAAAVHGHRAGGHELAVPVGGNIVVVAVEGPGADAAAAGEGVQLLQAGVRDQVGEEGAVRRPHRRVDVDHGRASGRNSCITYTYRSAAG